MKVEITKEQKEALGKKIELCQNFLRNEVQPHIVKSDTILVNMSDSLDLYITSTKIYVVEMQTLIPGLGLNRKRTLLLTKQPRNQTRNYICDAAPEMAVEFLKHWEQTKAQLEKQVRDKKEKVDALNRFVSDFQL